MSNNLQYIVFQLRVQLVHQLKLYKSPPGPMSPRGPPDCKFDFSEEYNPVKSQRWYTPEINWSLH